MKLEDKLLQSLNLKIKNVSNELIVDFITDAETDVRTHTNRPAPEALPVGCETIIKEIVLMRYNRFGSEGIASESFSGVSQSYVDDFPEDIKRRLNKFRRLP